MPDIELATVPAGSLAVQAAGGHRGRRVAIESFALGVFPVTQEQMAEILGDAWLGAPGEEHPHPRRPATRVSWQRAIRFCNAASEWEGLDLAYGVDADEVTWHVDADGYRLPTEAEWEFACRAGSTGPHYGPLTDIAWTSADGLRAPADVGGKLPNLHGLFDMLGNVGQWCWDLWDEQDPYGARVFRGGSYADHPTSVTAAVRRAAAPRSAQGDIGFRVARSL